MFDPEQVRNSKFDCDSAEEQLSKLLTQWWFANSHKGLAYSKSDICDLYSTRDFSSRLVGEMFDRMIDEAKVRREVSGHFGEWNVVSVGEDCFSRSIATRWGMRRSAEHGGKSGPFDLAVHPPGSLSRLIDSDFQDYLNPEKLSFQKSMNYCRNAELGVVFNHETGPEWAEDNFSKLITVIGDRVDRFRDVLKDNGRVCFLLHIGNPSAEKWSGVERLVGSLLSHSKSRSPVIICAATWKFGTSISPKTRGLYSGLPVHFIDRHYPFDGYVWHRDNRTHQGYIFERELVQRCVEIIKLYNAKA